MGLMDRFLTAIPDSGWRQAAHERRSPNYEDVSDQIFRQSREREATSSRIVQAEPARPRQSWHERFMPGDEYAPRQDQAAAEDPDAEEFQADDYQAPEYGAQDCETQDCETQDHPKHADFEQAETDAPEVEPELEPAAACSPDFTVVADDLSVDSDDKPDTAEISRPAPLESQTEYLHEFPELYPLGNGMAIDPEGFLTDTDGRYLKGLPLNPVAGTRTSETPEFINVEHHYLPAKATREVRYQANLPAYPMTAVSDPQLPGSELLDVRGFGRNPAASAFGVITAEDAPRFMGQSLSGGSVTIYDQTGAAVVIRLRWAKIASFNTGGGDRWNLFYLAWADAVSREIAWRNAGLDYTFGADGRLDPALPRVTLTNLMIDGLRIGDVTLVHGRDGITQFYGAHGVVKVRQLSQDGHVTGDFVGVDVTGQGVVSAKYSNGRITPLAMDVFACGDIPITADPETLRAAARLMRAQVAEDELVDMTLMDMAFEQAA
jgi:hypothetical protein